MQCTIQIPDYRILFILCSPCKYQGMQCTMKESHQTINHTFRLAHGHVGKLEHMCIYSPALLTQSTYLSNVSALVARDSSACGFESHLKHGVFNKVENNIFIIRDTNLCPDCLVILLLDTGLNARKKELNKYANIYSENSEIIMQNICTKIPKYAHGYSQI